MKNEYILFVNLAFNHGFINSEQAKKYLEIIKTQSDINIYKFFFESNILKEHQINKILNEIKNENNLESTYVFKEAKKSNLKNKYFDRYKIIEKIGQGGMGIVYKAYDNLLDREVALKVLLGNASDENEKERFLREAKATAKLSHPNVIKIHDIGIQNDKYFFAMKFIKAKSLKDLKKNPIRNTVKIMIKICDALVYVHEQGIIHRDLKPENILIDENKEPIIMDFGLAKINNPTKKLSKSGEIMGTFQYMPPEQAEGKSKNIDFRTDIYSVGAVFYYLLVGHPPFSGVSYINIILQILNKMPDFPAKLESKIPRKLKAIVLKCLEKNKDDRYENAEALKKDLERFLAGDFVEAKSISYVQKIKLWINNYKKILLINGFIFFTMLAFLVNFIYQKKIEFEKNKKIINNEIMPVFTNVFPKDIVAKYLKEDCFAGFELIGKTIFYKNIFSLSLENAFFHDGFFYFHPKGKLHFKFKLKNVTKNIYIEIEHFFKNSKVSKINLSFNEKICKLNYNVSNKIEKKLFNIGDKIFLKAGENSFTLEFLDTSESIYILKSLKIK